MKATDDDVNIIYKKSKIMDASVRMDLLLWLLPLYKSGFDAHINYEPKKCASVNFLISTFNPF